MMTNKIWLACFAAGVFCTSVHAQEVLIPKGAQWSYNDTGADLGTAWKEPAFNDQSWSTGPAEFGYGEGDEATVVSYGPMADARYATTYFRHEFSVVDPRRYDALEIRLLHDDGAIVYLNGVELSRFGLPAGPIAYNVFAHTAIFDYLEVYFRPFFVPATELVTGVNVLAVEIHQFDPADPDLSFDLQLEGQHKSTVIRGPYLQNMRSDAVTVRWRTAAPVVGAVWLGDAPGQMTVAATDTLPRRDHELEITGLDPASTFYYGVGRASAPAPTVGADPEHRFNTPPVPGSREPFRAWVLGDAGAPTFGRNRVRDAFVNLDLARGADLMLQLGDNAYRVGSDAEYQTAFFEAYPDILRRTPAFSTRGNHERDAKNYFSTYTLPSTGQSGGVASGTEAYYSFDWANVHFICLDSFESDRSPLGPMYVWAEADLASTTQDWIIAFWHHPPYSKGGHDSDVDVRLIEMRRSFLPLLEDYGVSLVLSGHCHSYERSGLIHGHYDLSTQWDPIVHGVDLGDGRPGSSGAYQHSTAGAPGTVYIVAGSSSYVDFLSVLDHPAMVESAVELGSLVIDVAGGRLDVTFLNDHGQRTDWFSIVDPTWSGTLCGGTIDGQGCTPTVTTIGAPSVTSASPFIVNAMGTRTQTFGLMAYSTAAAASNGPFNGRLCLGSGIKRTQPLASGGTTACTGSLSFDLATIWNSSAHPNLIPGETVYCQFWYRDQGVSLSSLTEAISFTLTP